MRVGFTGTRKGMSQLQHGMFTALVQSFIPMGVTEFHMGDCVGSDVTAATAVVWVMQANPEVAVRIIVHPPDKGIMRAHFQGASEVREPKPYLARNHDIVDETDLLIATPSGWFEERRSGTWATIRYAQKNNRPVVLLPPIDRPEVTRQLLR